MTQGPKGMRIDLDSWQTVELAPLIGQLAEMEDAGKPGMILAQVFPDFMRVGIISHEKALELQKVMGVPVGQRYDPWREAPEPL